MTPNRGYSNSVSEAIKFLDGISEWVKFGAIFYIAEGAEKLDTLMSNRIFKKGLNATGSKIGKYGRYYSREYKSLWVPLRNRFGLQTRYVDLYFTGDLKESLVVDRKNYEEVEFGFNSTEEHDKAMFQEMLQGKKAGGGPMDIFSVTAEEETKTLKEIEKNLIKGFNETISRLI
jgi:hypothetical protein